MSNLLPFIIVRLATGAVYGLAGVGLVRTYRMTVAELVANDTTYHSSAQELWDGDDVEYALLKVDWEQQEAAGGERVANNERACE